jgi:hypothetical protein
VVLVDNRSDPDDGACIEGPYMTETFPVSVEEGCIVVEV